MEHKDPIAFLSESIENYYRQNPDTLMPMLMLTLAINGKLQVSHDCTSKSVFCLLDLNEIAGYDWVKLDPALKLRVSDALNNGIRSIAAVGNIPEDIRDIFDIIYKYDNSTVEQEYHHRIGILHHHSSNEKSEKALRQYATFCLAEALMSLDADWLKGQYLLVANDILEKSGLQPARPRIQAGEALYALLEYDGKGKVYNPFAGCAIAAAMLEAGNNLYVDGDCNDKILAVSRLITYGSEGKPAKVRAHDSKEWTTEDPDYVLSTYRGYVEGKTAFDFCLGKCLENFHGKGRYAGIVSPRDIFENQSKEIKEALDKDWVDTIALLPFGEVAVLIDVAKSERKNKVRFINMNHPILRRRPLGYALSDEDYSDLLKVSDVKKRGYLKSLLPSGPSERDGSDIVRVCDYVHKIQRRTYSLENLADQDRVLTYIDRSEQYFSFSSSCGLEKKPISYLFTPAYHLTKNSLIVNASGALEPRLYDADDGASFFLDGYAFALNDPSDADWLISELNEPYVSQQLYPYGSDVLLPETYSEKDILNLRVYRVEEQEQDDEEPDWREEEKVREKKGKLQPGQVLNSKFCEYTINQYLGHGYFGFTYTANCYNKRTGETKNVVLKEFYPIWYYHREGIRAVLDNPEDINFELNNKSKFKKEAKIMKLLGNKPDSHIVPASDAFEIKETGTLYYEMPFYESGSIKDQMKKGVYFSEEMTIKHIAIPLCKALKIAHKHKIQHLDIKPENVLIDEEGNGVLIDFGVAQQYDTDGQLVSNRANPSRSPWSSPENTGGRMVSFGTGSDIFGLAGTLFTILTGNEPHPIGDSDEWNDIYYQLNCSDEMCEAIMSGLQYWPTDRPANAEVFARKFPGCESIKL